MGLMESGRTVTVRERGGISRPSIGTYLWRGQISDAGDRGSQAEGNWVLGLVMHHVGGAWGFQLDGKPETLILYRCCELGPSIHELVRDVVTYP